MKNSIIRLRLETEDKQIVEKAMNKIKEKFNFDLTEPQFLRSALVSYCKDIISGEIQLMIIRK